MRSKFTGLVVLCLGLLVMSFTVFAEDKKAERQTDPNATNFTAAYPTAEESLPAMPMPPENMKDAKTVTEYIKAVDAYLKASQGYIDATTNDLNKIVAERNIAVQNANKAVADYNAFIDGNSKKK